MRTPAAWLALALISVLPAPAQNKSPQLADFAGTWKSEFHKQVWLVLTLTPSNGSLSGSLAHSVQISADDKGEITSVGEEMSTDTVASVALRGATLHITARDEDGNSDEYTLLLAGPDSADLQPVTSAPTGAPKPFHVKRTAAAQK